MKRIALSVLFVVSGCGAMIPGRTRSVSMEIPVGQGYYRLDGIDHLTLEMAGWQVRVLDSKVNAVAKVPLLERLVLEIVNTATDLPLVVEPTEISIKGIDNEPVLLGSGQRTILNPRQSLILRYDPGLRADLLPYPFTVNIEVFRGLNFEDPQIAKLVLY